jgi:CDP-diacylglycerol--glycerol-3-phosphate 3-phosphatidyltransferase
LKIENMNYRDFLQKIIYYGIDPFIKGMIKLGITPNGITAAGFAGNLLAMWFFLDAATSWQHMPESSFNLIGWGGFIILAAGLFDMIDGRMARLGNMSSRFGALWDSTLDRYSELVTLFGICLIFVKADWFWLSVTTFAAMVGSVMVSYVRARAEGLGIECKVGLMQRPERVVVTAVTAIITGITEELWWLAGGMILIAVLANITAFWRIGHCYKELK